MRYGTIYISKKSIHLIWDDTPYCPKPFPLIMKRSVRKDSNHSVRISKHPKRNELKIQSKHLQSDDFVWAGPETIRVERREDPPESEHDPSSQLIQILTNQQDAPLELLEPDSKTIEVSRDSFNIPEKSLECKWFWKDSVLRTKQGQIVGIPRYSDWNECVCLQQDHRMQVKVKWNVLLKKYQVITISKNE